MDFLRALIIAAFVCLSVSAFANDFHLSNGYISLKGSGGMLCDLRVDPAGKGGYGPVVIKQMQAGDAIENAADSSFRVDGNSVTIDAMRIYSSPRLVELDRFDTHVQLDVGNTLGQSIIADADGLSSISVRVPTYTNSNSAMTLSLYAGGPGGRLIASKRFEDIDDNSWPVLKFPAQAKGIYYLEMSDPTGPVGWWSTIEGETCVGAWENGKPVDGMARCFRAKIYDVFSADIKLSLVGPKLFARVVPDKKSQKYRWSVITPFVRDGYETTDAATIPFSRFYSDAGQYLPIAQLKRKPHLEFPLTADKLFYATGNGMSDLAFTMDGCPVNFVVEPDSMTIELGQVMQIAVKSHTDAVPDFFPVFYTSDVAFDESLNSFFYDRAFSWPMGGVVAADWFEWFALIFFWNHRPGVSEWWRTHLLNYKMDDEGYVYAWGDRRGWPFPDNDIYDARHFTTNPNFVLGVYRYYAWTKDLSFLKSNAARVRKAMSFMLNELGGDSGIITLPDKDHGGTKYDLPSNYWDDIPFGGKSAYENAYFYASLGAMASIEAALGEIGKAKYYNSLRVACRKQYNEMFWNDKAGRYIGCIDKTGAVHDYGFTYVNMEAATYGLADKSQVERIYKWMEDEPTSSGKADTYSRFKFAPRCNTIDCKGWWYHDGKGEIPAQEFDVHLENGGAILYTSGYDLMARAKYLGADNAFKRLKEILERYEEPDRLAGGAPLFHGENNGWQVGTDYPFPESGLVPAAFLHAFLGIAATSDGLLITPNLPASLKHAGIKNLKYKGMMLNIKVTPNSVSITGDGPTHKIRFNKAIAPGESVLFNG